MRDTIVQICTAQSAGAIAIVRLSGERAVDIAKEMFSNSDFLSKPRSHTIYYGFVSDGAEKIDEALLSVMLAPKSYTKEDVVEINCHGGLAVTRRVLAAAAKRGARLAEPGEFTKRAYLNGRIDLSQAEAVADLIYAKTDYAAKNSLRRLSGGLRTAVSEIRGDILTQIASIEASIDFPEHELHELNIRIIKKTLNDAVARITRITENAGSGRLLFGGIDAVITGRPNVGKSSLFNALLNEARAIVASVPGTTRDTITEYVSFGDILFKITDTAGLREATGETEREGVIRARQAAEDAALAIAVIDGSVPLTRGDKSILAMFKGKNAVIAINKSDLPQAADISQIESILPEAPRVFISAKNKTGTDGLISAARALFFKGALPCDEEFLLTKQRHIDAFSRAKAALLNALETANAGLSEDLLTGDLTECYEALGEITGESLDDEIIDKIFESFCIGK